MITEECRRLTAWAGQGDDSDEQIPLCRSQYLGDDDHWGFAIYDPATETCTDAILQTGERAGHPSDAFDTAAIIHLTDYQQCTSRRPSTGRELMACSTRGRTGDRRTTGTSCEVRQTAIPARQAEESGVHRDPRG